MGEAQWILEGNLGKWFWRHGGRRQWRNPAQPNVAVPFHSRVKATGQFRVVRKSAGQPHLAEFVASLHQKNLKQLHHSEIFSPPFIFLLSFLPPPNPFPKPYWFFPLLFPLFSNSSPFSPPLRFSSNFFLPSPPNSLPFPAFGFSSYCFFAKMGVSD